MGVCITRAAGESVLLECILAATVGLSGEGMWQSWGGEELRGVAFKWIPLPLECLLSRG